MAEYLSPGIFIEEINNAPQTVEGIGTSTMAIVGWTVQGPPDEAVLITSPESYLRTFGKYSNKSLVPISVSAFFANGGTRCYVVRVAPSDSVAASGTIPGPISGEAYGTGTGADPTALAHTLTYQPTPGTITVSWAPEVPHSAFNPVMTPAEDGAALGPFTTTLPDAPLTTGTLTLVWDETGAKTATLSGTNTVAGADAANIASASINRTTGLLTITFAAAHAPTADSIRVTYDGTGTASTVTDVDGGAGTGTFTAADVTGTVTYATGTCSITWSGAAVPYLGCAITVAYTGNQWGLAAANVGLWGNDIKVRLKGNENTFVYGTTATTGVGTYSKYDLLVLQKNSVMGGYEVKETFEELSFADSSDAMYAPDVVNDGSDLIVLADFGFMDVPAGFKGTSYTAEVVGAGTGAQTAFTHTTAHRPIVKASPVIHYTRGGTAYTLTCNSSGQFSSSAGHLDMTKTNSINFTSLTGVNVTINFTLAAAPDAATNVTIDYVAMPAKWNGTATMAEYSFAGGADGTMTTITRSLVSDSALLRGAKKGLYALDRIDEMMTTIIPDFAGDVAVQGDMIAYAESRRDLFCVLTTPKGMDAQEAVDYVRITFVQKSKYAAMYWPWIRVADPLANNRPMTIPPVAHIAGIYARTDLTKNVAKAPGGTIDGALRQLIGLEKNPDKGERDLVYPANINPLINTPQTGLCVWGVRSISSTNDAFKYIASTRLFIFVEKSVFNSTHSLVFENIGGTLYTRIKGQIEGFLRGLFNDGYFAGATPSQAFVVICDSSNNPKEVVNAGQVIVDVGIAPNRPGEFIRFRFAEKVNA